MLFQLISIFIFSSLCLLYPSHSQPSSSSSSSVLITAHAPIGRPLVSPSIAASLPDHFDARIYWPQCTSIRDVSTQGTCGSCWAQTAADVLSDRFCIASGGKVNVKLSPWHLLQCCGLGVCADGLHDFGGCAGGDPYPALKFISEEGIVSEECKPSPSWLLTHSESPLDAAVDCEHHCANQTQNYSQSLYYVSEYYRLPNDEATICHEILTRGPVMAHVDHSTWADEDEDFDWSTVFSCRPDAKPIHSVRLIGWGVYRGRTPYWLAVNSWGTDWGVNGTLKIARGRNSCYVESMVTAAIPKL